jgi:hypothetical protein
MARDRPSKDRPIRDPIPEDEDLPLLYPEEDDVSGGVSGQDLYDPFAEDTWSDPPAGEGPGEPDRGPGPADRGRPAEASSMPGKPPIPPPPKPGGSGTKPTRRDEGERLHRLLDIESTDTDPPRTSQDEDSLRGVGNASQARSESVFEPIRVAPPPGPRARPERSGKRRPRPRPADRKPEQSAETVFQPRKVADDARSGRPGPDVELPEDPRDLPKVKPTYDRGREAGPIFISVVILLAVGVATTVNGTVAGVLVVLGGLAWGVYRFALILAHPVRVTPEQAVREFYDAFCHRVPNYRRMYLLLSVPAKRDKQINSYRAFCAYWGWRQAQVVGKRYIEAAAFDIERFEAKYNAQRTFATVDFTLLLYRRGNPQNPVFVRPVSTTLVKGRDGSWYLNEGTLP